jgi:hypothetical protein
LARYKDSSTGPRPESYRWTCFLIISKIL